MNKINLIIGVLCLIVNIICGLVLSFYPAFNCGVSSAVIVLNMGIMHLVSTIQLKDAFRISLNFLFPILAIIEFFMALFAPERFQNNGFIIFISITILIKAVILVITNTLSNNK